MIAHKDFPSADCQVNVIFGNQSNERENRSSVLSILYIINIFADSLDLNIHCIGFISTLQMLKQNIVCENGFRKSNSRFDRYGLFLLPSGGETGP